MRMPIAARVVGAQAAEERGGSGWPTEVMVVRSSGGGLLGRVRVRVLAARAEALKEGRGAWRS